MKQVMDEVESYVDTVWIYQSLVFAFHKENY